jgi:vitamin B12 transporter
MGLKRKPGYRPETAKEPKGFLAAHQPASGEPGAENRNFTIMLFRSTALSAALVLALPVHAEEVPVFIGDEIVVTPTRAPQKIEQIIGDVSVITASQIAEAGQTTLIELLQSQPGIEIAQQGGAGTNAAIRIRGGNSNHALVLVDGLRVGSATAGTTPLESISLDQIERIEILRGPASSLYGADAVTGVIQIFTKRGSGEPRISASLGAGSHGLVKGDVDYAGESGATRFSLGAGYGRTDGGFSAARPGTYGYMPDDDGESEQSAHLNVEHALSVGHSIGISGLYNRSRVEYDAGTPNDYAINHVNDVSAWWKGHLAEGWQSKLLMGLGQNHTQNYGGSPGKFDTNQIQYQWQNDFRLPVGGLSASLERLEQEVDAAVDFSQSRRTANAGQLGYQAQLGAHTLQASLRHDDYSDFGWHTTGMAGYAYAFAPAWRVSASYGTSFKAPTFNDLYWPASPWFHGNPDLKPEEGRNLELSLRYLQGRNQFSLVAYRNRVKDLIAYVYPTMENVGRARLDGITLSGQTEFRGVRIRASIDRQEAVDAITDKGLPYRAPLYGKLDVSRSFDRWEVGASLVASDRRNPDPYSTQKLAGYALVDLRADYHYSPQWKLFARINNVLDANYQLNAGYNTPGINGFLGLQYSER